LVDLRFEVEPSDGNVLGGVVDPPVELKVVQDLLLGMFTFADPLEPLLEDWWVLKLALDRRRRSFSEENEGITVPPPCTTLSEGRLV